MQLQTLALVAAEVFGRALPVLLQALLLLAVLLAVSFMTTACAPVRSRSLVMLEFASFCVLSLTITLGLSFTAEEAISPVAGVRRDMPGCNDQQASLFIVPEARSSCVLCTTCGSTVTIKDTQRRRRRFGTIIPVVLRRPSPLSHVARRRWPCSLSLTCPIPLQRYQR